ncbi:MAG TPA: hypothetical protein VFW94_02965 [Candidatus Acidoferrales bacterium]|nr:hypothetical protein [Candidatus Acidoferrales bacterium]
MSEQIVSAAEAVIHGLTEQLAQACRERDQYKRERDEARAILAHSRTSLAEAVNDPAMDGQP